MACGGDAAQCQSDLTEMVFPLTFEQIERQVNMCASLLREMIVSYHVAEKEVQNAWFALLDAVVSRHSPCLFCPKCAHVSLTCE